ncbi:LPXTG cell wall anchor domain-containing protein [Thermoclostridium caenicola]
MDQDVPYAGATLPQTGGIPVEFLIGTGVTLISAGFSLRKKDKKE